MLHFFLLSNKDRLAPAHRPIWSVPAVLLTIPLLFCYCGTKQDTRIRQMADERVQAFLSTELAACRARQMEDAERMVDSLLLAEAKAEILDSLNRARPLRPAPPVPLEPIDSAKVRPIFEKEY